jgi:hypothetical protein
MVFSGTPLFLVWCIVVVVEIIAKLVARIAYGPSSSEVEIYRQMREAKLEMRKVWTPSFVLVCILRKFSAI